MYTALCVLCCTTMFDQAHGGMQEEDDDDDFDVQLDEQTQRGRPTQQAQRQVALSNAAIGAVPGQAAAAIPVRATISTIVTVPPV